LVEYPTHRKRQDRFTEPFVRDPFQLVHRRQWEMFDERHGAQYRRKPTWRHVSAEIAKAAEGEKDLLEICVSLRLVLALEGVDCLVK
jgi:hypothetical protein